MVKAGHVGMQQLRNVRGPHKHFLRNSIRELRAWHDFGRRTRRRVIRDAGWHFTYLGGPEAIQTKLSSTSGGAKIAPNFDQTNKALARIGRGIEPSEDSNRRLELKSLDSGFPRYILENKDRFRHLIGEDGVLSSTGCSRRSGRCHVIACRLVEGPQW